MAVSDDDVIRRKLLIEGDGGNDDRRINSLLKTFIKWSSSTESDDESRTVYQRMLATLSQVELAQQKSLHVHQMNLREQHNYDSLNKQIEQSIKEAYEKIAECKAELHQAKRVRHNRQEYDALAKVIQQHPDRQTTLKQLTVLDRELKQIHGNKESLQTKLELRRKQFHVLVSAIHEMQRILEADEQKEAELEETSMDTSSLELTAS